MENSGTVIALSIQTFTYNKPSNISAPKINKTDGLPMIWVPDY